MLVGGFLGAGKTTLILRAAQQLRARGLRVAVITNDQDQGLVDTMMAKSLGWETREVAGGCFCCRFSDLVDAAGQLAALQPDVIFAEPVGSCLDIAATILRPLQAYHGDVWQVAPYTVLLDPELAERVFAGRADPDVAYLFKNQLAEADILCLNKRDRHPGPLNLPAPVEMSLSAMTGEGVGEWLARVLEPGAPAGTRLLDVDYERYADAEAALGWVNVHAELVLEAAAGPAMIAGPVLDEIDARLTAAGISIAHLKVFDQTASGYVKATICANGDEPEPEGDLIGPPEALHQFVINLRAAGDPDELRDAVAQTLNRIHGAVRVKHSGAFRPPPPKPQFREDRVRR